MRCDEHGSLMDSATCSCLVNQVLDMVDDERARQFKLHGSNLENRSGTGPDVRWATALAGYTGAPAEILQTVLRRDYEGTEAEGEKVTWLQILLEEFAEVAEQSDPARLLEELVQVAAVAVSWAEKILDPESVIGSKPPLLVG